MFLIFKIQLIKNLIKKFLILLAGITNFPHTFLLPNFIFLNKYFLKKILLLYFNDISLKEGISNFLFILWHLAQLYFLIIIKEEILIKLIIKILCI